MPAKQAAKQPARKSAKQSLRPQELLLTELREIHSAETQLSRALPKIMKAIDTEELRPLIEQRQDEGRRLVEAIEAAFEQMGASPGRKKNVAAEGLIADAQEHIQEIERGPALDATLIAALQKTEHYCIAAWGTVRSMANVLGEQSVVDAMERALEEGRSLDEELTRFAETQLYPMMMEEDEENGEEGMEAMDDEEEDEESAQAAPPSGGRRSSRKGDTART